MDDKKLFKVLGIFLLLPIALAFFSGDRYRYPCQDPNNWDKEICKLPQCDITRSCPEHIFKGQRDPRLGPAPVTEQPTKQSTPTTGVTCK